MTRTLIQEPHSTILRKIDDVEQDAAPPATTYLARLKALAEAARQRGPWKLPGEKHVLTQDGCLVCDVHFQSDAEFIAAANPRAILDFIAQFEAMRARAEKAEASLATAEKLSVESNSWQPIETADPVAKAIFWLEWSDDCAKLRPPLAASKWSDEQRFIGHPFCWPSVYKAVLWQPLPKEPCAEETGWVQQREESEAIKLLRAYWDHWENGPKRGGGIPARGHSAQSSIWYTIHTPVTYEQHERARTILAKEGDGE